ncbi:hypothetical protein CDL12_27669 [Handroanthus impetiginosus]|uniref:Glycine-rich protein n=1 Tax=Handroanthus impetiginosus TaxID=429701 RepID=A0A2G9G3D6_9LAMI|nr:hypothetical protein CDL12_27669 [Handroanthus impetiginosus]
MAKHIKFLFNLYNNLFVLHLFRRNKMRMKEKLLILPLVMAFLCSCVLASTSPSEEILHLGHLQGNMKHKAIAHPNKFGHASSGGCHVSSSRGNGRAGGGHGDDSNGGGSSAVIPLYGAAAGGAANKHNGNHHKHNGGNSNYGYVGIILTFALAISTCLMLWEGRQL